MAQHPRPDDLAQLRALIMDQQAALAAQRAVTAAQQARLAQLERRRFPRRFLPLAIVVLLAALMPLSMLAAGPTFSDLGTAAPVHQPNIQAIGDAGISTGFEDPNDPTKRVYDPKANVTREEMASFLARTAGLGGNAPVANAKTAQTAADAAQLGGSPASAFVRAAAAFRHTATGANSASNYTVIDNPLTNGKPAVLLFVTPYLGPNAVYSDHEIGVSYGGNRWLIFAQDDAAIPAGASYNILAIAP